MGFVQHAAVLSAFAIIAAVIVFARPNHKAPAPIAALLPAPSAAQIAALQK
jgi:hypothetical protein